MLELSKDIQSPSAYKRDSPSFIRRRSPQWDPSDSNSQRQGLLVVQDVTECQMLCTDTLSSPKARPLKE